ncbi:hypothetical protein DL769_009389 [Monosporascus sp. CRB-8-3]|nr:hypothetical protein DL769_009389 [Monosporascus sp. CRB-8-3]
MQTSKSAGRTHKHANQTTGTRWLFSTRTQGSALTTSVGVEPLGDPAQRSQAEKERLCAEYVRGIAPCPRRKVPPS